MYLRKLRKVFEEADCTIWAGRQSDGDFFGNVLRVRGAEREVPTECNIDPYSDHYCMFVDSNPVGVVTTTRLVNGELDCHEFYPRVVLERFKDQLFSSCKFRILKNEQSGFRLLRVFLRAFWLDQLEQGSRLDVMNSEKSMARFYEKIGYAVIPGSEFIHPILGTDSVAMTMSADPTRASFCQTEFQGVDTPLAMADVFSTLCGDAASTVLPEQPEQWSGYDRFKTSNTAIQEHYDAVNHCHSLALSEIMDSRSQCSLDIACGFAESTRLVSRFSETVIGIDSSEEMIRVAEEQKLGEKFRFICSRFEDFDGCDRPFDLISATWFLNHVHDEASLEAVISKVNDLLRPGGYVSFVTPASSFTSRATQDMAREHLDWEQAWTEQRDDFTRGVFSYGENWISTTIWEPMKLMRVLARWFDVQCWDVKRTIVAEQRLNFLKTEPPFEVIYGTKREMGGVA